MNCCPQYGLRGCKYFRGNFILVEWDKSSGQKCPQFRGVHKAGFHCMYLQYGAHPKYMHAMNSTYAVNILFFTYCMYCTYIHTYSNVYPSYHTAVIPPPQLQSSIGLDSVVTIMLGAATAERSERYISSLERTDLGVPLEVEFEQTQSSGADDYTIDRQVSAPGAVYNIKIWSINGASFSSDPVTASTTLLFDTGKEVAS